MAAKQGYLKLGIFVITGVVLLLGGLLALGARELFRKTVIFETYFDQSLTGLEEGAPVRFRGVKVGNVEEIAFVEKYYVNAGAQMGRLLVVRIAADHEFLQNMVGNNVQKSIDDAVNRGLRMQFSQSGITGIGYIELDYQDPEREQPMKLAWKPETYYIPSATSRITRIAESIESVSRQLEDSHLDEIADDIRKLVTTVDEKAAGIDTQEISTHLEGLLAEARQTTERVNQLINQPSVDETSTNIAEVTRQANEMMTELRTSLNELVTQVDGAVADFRKSANQVDALLNKDQFKEDMNNFSLLLENLRTTTEELPQSADKLNRVTQRLELFLTSQTGSLESIIANVNRVSANLRRVSETAEKEPSLLILGERDSKAEAEK